MTMEVTIKVGSAPAGTMLQVTTLNGEIIKVIPGESYSGFLWLGGAMKLEEIQVSPVTAGAAEEKAADDSGSAQTPEGTSGLY